MNFNTEYRKKLRTPEEAVRVVKSGDSVDYTMALGFPILLDRALAARRDELTDIKVYGTLLFGPLEIVECDPLQAHFSYSSWHCSGYDRKLCDKGLCSYRPMVFRNILSYYRRYLHVNVAMCSVTPMDKHGYFNLSCAAGIAKCVMDEADIVIVEVNERLPRVFGGYDEVIHISEVDMIVEGEHSQLTQITSPPPTVEDKKIAEHIMPFLKDGSVLQLGVGGLPNLIGNMIASSDLKDLGMHSELCCDAFVDLCEAGKLTNARNTIHRGKGMAGIIFGTDRLYDWIDENPGVTTGPIDYINAPETIARMHNMVSINSCIAADLYGQVCAESAGLRHISGTGGQLDYVTGAYDSPGGYAFICMTSTYRDKKGNLHSRILPHFNGDTVTDPRSQAHYIVTEYGAVNLAGTSLRERAERLISIAHPDFREGLERAAFEQGIWRRSNGR